MSLLSAFSSPDLFDDEVSLLPGVARSLVTACRMPDGRTLSWAEYGSIRGLPCLLIPDTDSSRLAPGWLLHDTALPAQARLMCLDRPGVGDSDPVGLGGHANPADDLLHMINTLAVGRVAVIGIGAGFAEALALATRHPGVVAGVTGVSVRLPGPEPRRWILRRRGTDHGMLSSWLAAAGTADLSRERTWRRALPKMDIDARTALGDRWCEADFRAAVAEDAAQQHPDSSIPVITPVEGAWADASWQVGCPVHLWHGQSEINTPSSSVRDAVESRPGWELSVVPGATALWGAWPRIISAAAVPLAAPFEP